MDVALTVPAAVQAAAGDAVIARDEIEQNQFRITTTASGYQVETPRETYVVASTEALRSAIADHPACVTDWYYWTRQVTSDDDGRAFLRLLERAPIAGATVETTMMASVYDRYHALESGIETTWGELVITTALTDDGQRRYTLCHQDDTDADTETLRTLTADELHQFVKTDADGRYRPLKTAPTLRSGWIMADLSGETLLKALDRIYPATVTNWYQERTDQLVVTHWQASLDRRVGQFDLDGDLPPDAVEWVAEACCTDSQCLKRREWEYDEQHPVGVDRGHGAFPCREPCELAVAAARRWQASEQEHTQEYTISLTPTERDHLNELLDAVADGDVGSIREAAVDNGGNRYRARYLRAKLADEDGIFEPATQE